MSENIKEMASIAKNFEKIVDESNGKSKKIAWTIAGIMTAITFCLTIAFSFLLPLKQVELAIVTVDNTTGTAEKLTQAKEETVLQSDVVGRYFVSQYIKLREGYNYPSLQSDYDTVQLYSDNAVKDDYLRLYESDNAPDKVYKNNGHYVVVDIISSPITAATSPDKLATVRFKKTIRNLRTGQVSIEYWAARVTFQFKPSKTLTSSERDLNPLGFSVTSFVAEKELRG